MIQKLFPTYVYTAPLMKNTKQLKSFLREIRSDIQKIQDFDVGGHQWSEENYPGGYTSYSSIPELHQFSSLFSELRDLLDGHVKRFGRSLDMDLKNYPLSMTESWVNVMPPLCVHSGHIHPHASVSGTFYVDVPRGTSPLKFEDPRLGFYMGSVPRKATTRSDHQQFVSVQAFEGQVTLFESWLRHEVPPNKVEKTRRSISFNYNWF